MDNGTIFITDSIGMHVAFTNTFECQNWGVPGQGLHTLDVRDIDARLAVNPADEVIIALGWNDFGYAHGTFSQIFYSAYWALISHCLEHVEHVTCLSLWPTPENLRVLARKPSDRKHLTPAVYDCQIILAAGELGARYIDISGVSYKTEDTVDGVHPTAGGALRLAEQIQQLRSDA